MRFFFFNCWDEIELECNGFFNEYLFVLLFDVSILFGIL